MDFDINFKKIMVPFMKTFIEGLEAKYMQFILLLLVKIYMWIIAIMIMNL
jgi:hypothetical protein